MPSCFITRCKIFAYLFYVGQAFSEGSSSDGAAEEEVIEVSSKN